MADFPEPSATSPAYFDNSAWNVLWRRPDRDAVTASLRGRGVKVLGSIFSAAEVANTSDFEKRRGLTNLLREIHGDGPLLEHPMVMARPAAEAILRGDRDYRVPEIPQTADILRFLSDPTDEASRQEYRAWAERLATKFDAAFELAKPSVPDPTIDLVSREALESDPMLDFLIVFQPARDAGLTREQMRVIIDSPADSVWSTLGGMFLYVITLANHHATQKRRSALDLWQTLYLGLPIAAFVTNDKRQAEAALRIRSVLKQQPKVLTLEEFVS